MKPVLYAQLVERSGGHCENPDCRKAFGIGLLTQEADHFHSRRVPDSLDSLWLLCRQCHREKTDNKPDAATWLNRFLVHAEKYGYRASYERALRRLQYVEQKQAFRKAGGA